MRLTLSALVPERGLDAALVVESGETVALLGPNGSGKSTLLGVAAGLVAATSAEVTLGGRVLTSVGLPAMPAVVVPPHARRVGLLAQDPMLFPHLSALDNVAFGPRSRGLSRAAASAVARDWLARVSLAGDGVERRRPGELSGGQAQRVALARALAAEPDLVLLDEPFAALDVEITPALRATVREVLAGRTAVIATHDILDAALLADRVVVLDGGRVVEQGPTREFLARPRSPFGARIAGLNLVAGAWCGDGIRTPDGVVVRGRSSGTVPNPPIGGLGTVPRPPDGVVVRGRSSGTVPNPPIGGLGTVPNPPIGGLGTRTVAGAGRRDGEPMLAVFRPSAVAVYPDRRGEAVPGSPRNALGVEVTAVEPRGDLVRVRAGGLSADITPAAAAELNLVPGARAIFVVKAAEVDIYPGR